jgi:asparagine synthase (glutamine-hydrolysing)
MYFIRMLGSFRLGELAKGMTYYSFRRRKLPRLGLRTMLRRALGIPYPSRPEYPTWLNPSFEAKYKLPERWEEKMRPVAGAHPRAGSYEALTNPLWQQLFASYTPDATASPVEVRYPFLDVRLIRYLLRIPSLPWCFEKVMLRVAMQGRLPEPVRMRPKTPIVSDPILVRLREKTQQPLCARLREERTIEYVDRTKVANSLSLLDSNNIWTDVRPISLAYWLSGAHAS